MKVFIVDTPAWSKSTSPGIAPNRCGSRSLVESVECLLVRNALAAAQVRAASKRGTLVDSAGLVLRVLRSGAKSWSQRTIIAANVAMSGSSAGYALSRYLDFLPQLKKQAAARRYANRNRQQ